MSEPRDHTDLRDAAENLLRALDKPDVDPSKVKQVLVLRVKYPDGKGGKRKLRLGKYVAQGSHGAMKVFFDRIISIQKTEAGYVMSVLITPEMAAWAAAIFTKIVVGVDTEEDLLRCHQLAQDVGIPSALIEDAGRTEFHGQVTPTCVCIGPALAEDIDKITGPEGAVKVRLL